MARWKGKKVETVGDNALDTDRQDHNDIGA